MSTAGLQPDREQLAVFVAALFKHASTGAQVSLRSFYDEGKVQRFEIKTVCVDNREQVIEAAWQQAMRAANAKQKVVFCPPVATFSNNEHARKEDVVDGLTLSAEIDKQPQQARTILEALLGPATVVVESGGIWHDAESGKAEPKLHLHWRLKTPARGGDRELLEAARKLVIKIAGSDPTHAPISHPIRWPGSWHRKDQPRPCRIIENSDCEIDLHVALAALKQAAPAASANSGSASGEANWGELIGQVLTGESYHEPLARLASKLLTAGTNAGAAINLLRGLMETAASPRDARWQARYNDIPRAVQSAEKKFASSESNIMPVDLWGSFPPPELPAGLLPPAIEEFAIAQSEMMGCDAGGLAMAALAVCAAAIPDRIQLQVKRHDAGWKEPARIWVALVAPPSGKKSPIIKQASKPLVDIDNELYRAYVEKMKIYEALPTEEKKGTRPPQQIRLRIEDTTIEAAQVVLRDSPDGVLCLQDELSGWFGSMDKYAGTRGAAKDRGFWLQSWNGGSCAINRIGRGASIIENLSVSMLGGIQPDLARKFAADSFDDGLIQRLFCIVLPDGRAGKDELRLDEVENYENLINKLHKLQPPTIQGEGNLGGLLPGVLRFATGAQKLRTQLEQKHLDLQRCEAINRKLGAHIGKYDGLFARLCVLWHCIENADRELPPIVPENIARRVEAFLHKFLLPHSIAFYAGVLGLSDDHDRLTAVAGYILARKLPFIANAHIQHGDRTMRKLSKKDTAVIFEQLEALGWIFCRQGKRPGVATRWEVNQRVHQQFADRAAQESSRRLSIREAIAASLGKA